MKDRLAQAATEAQANAYGPLQRVQGRRRPPGGGWTYLHRCQRRERFVRADELCRARGAGSGGGVRSETV